MSYTTQSSVRFQSVCWDKMFKQLSKAFPAQLSYSCIVHRLISYRCQVVSFCQFRPTPLCSLLMQDNELVIARTTIISGSTKPIFAIFTRYVVLAKRFLDWLDCFLTTSWLFSAHDFMKKPSKKTNGICRKFQVKGWNYYCVNHLLGICGPDARTILEQSKNTTLTQKGVLPRQTWFAKYS